jgi:hypothetical protein
MLLVGCKAEEISESKSTIEVFNAVVTNEVSNEYAISDQPLFTANDIEYYDWNKHRIVFKDMTKYSEIGSKVIKLPYIGSELFNTGSRDKFLLYIDGEMIYEGYYNQSMLSSFMPLGIVITDEEDGISILFSYITGEEDKDKRSDVRIYEALKNNDLLRE